MAKTHVDFLELNRETSLPNLRSTKGGIGFEGTTPKYWNGTSWISFSSGSGGGVSTWDELYDLDKALTLDDGTLTFTLTKTSGAGLTLAASGAATGAVLSISNAGSGADVSGTDATWSISKAGALLIKTIAHPTTNTALTIDANGTGKVTIAGTSTGIIELQRNTTLAASRVLTLTGVGGSNMFVLTAGDAVMSDSSLTITDADNAATFALTNNTVTTADLFTVTSTSQTTGNTIIVTANALTEGYMFKGVTTAAGLTTGGFLLFDDGSARFAVGADGATAITSGVNSTVALKVTGIQTSEDMVEFTSSGVTADNKGVLLINSSGNSASGSNQIRIAPSGTPVEGSVGLEFVGASKVMQAVAIDGDSVNNSVVLINGGGALADNKAVVEITADGATQSAGGCVLRVANSGTPNAGSIGIEGVFTSKDMYYMYLAGGSATNSAVFMTSTGAIADNKAVLEITGTGTPANTGSNLLRVDGSGLTATNKPTLFEVVGAGKDVIGMAVDTDSVGNVATINGGGALADNTAVLAITADGTPAAGGSNVLRVSFTGTDTNKPTVFEVVGDGKDCIALSTDADPTASSANYMHSAGVLAADKATLELVSDAAACDADSSVLRVEQTAADGVAHCVTLKQDDESQTFINFEGTAGSEKTVDATQTTPGTVYGSIAIAINGTKKRIPVYDDDWSA